MLFGPDGKPMQGGRVVGGPKSVTDVPPFQSEEVQTFAQGMNNLIEQGHPMEIPAALAFQDICRFIRTIQVLTESMNADREMLQKALGTVRFLLQESVDDPEEHWVDITELAQSLRTHLGAELLPGESA